MPSNAYVNGTQVLDLVHGVDGPEGGSVAEVQPHLDIEVRGVVGNVGQKRCSKSQRAHDLENCKQNLRQVTLRLTKTRHKQDST